MYLKYNAALRHKGMMNSDDAPAESKQHSEEQFHKLCMGNYYVSTLHAINSAVVKLGSAPHRPQPRLCTALLSPLRPLHPAPSAPCALCTLHPVHRSARLARTDPPPPPRRAGEGAEGLPRHLQPRALAGPARAQRVQRARRRRVRLHVDDAQARGRDGVRGQGCGPPDLDRLRDQDGHDRPRRGHLMALAVPARGGAPLPAAHRPLHRGRRRGDSPSL